MLEKIVPNNVSKVSSSMQHKYSGSNNSNIAFDFSLCSDLLKIYRQVRSELNTTLLLGCKIGVVNPLVFFINLFKIASTNGLRVSDASPIANSFKQSLAFSIGISLLRLRLKNA